MSEVDEKYEVIDDIPYKKEDVVTHDVERVRIQVVDDLDKVFSSEFFKKHNAEDMEFIVNNEVNNWLSKQPNEINNSFYFLNNYIDFLEWIKKYDIKLDDDTRTLLEQYVKHYKNREIQA